MDDFTTATQCSAKAKLILGCVLAAAALGASPAWAKTYVTYVTDATITSMTSQPVATIKHLPVGYYILHFSAYISYNTASTSPGRTATVGCGFYLGGTPTAAPPVYVAGLPIQASASDVDTAIQDVDAIHNTVAENTVSVNCGLPSGNSSNTTQAMAGTFVVTAVHSVTQQ
jgi:hypothetical protein